MKKLMKMCFAMWMAVIMVLTNCSFAAIFTSSAKDTYLQLEKKNFESMEKLFENIGILFNTDYSRAKVQASLYGENLPGDLNNLKITAIEEIDKTKDYQYENVILENKEGDKLSLELIINDNILSIQVPELYEKYISIDLSKVKEVCEKFGIDVDEKEVEKYVNQISNSSELQILSDEDMKYLEKVLPNYAKKLNVLASNDKFFINENEVVEYDNKSISAKSVSYKISFDEVFLVMSDLFNDIKKDEKLLDIFVYILTYDDIGEINREELIYEIDALIEDGKKGIEELETIEIMSTLYYNNKKETLKREIKMVNTNMDEEVGFDLITINNNNEAYYELAYEDGKIIDRVRKEVKKVEHNISVISQGINYDWDYETYELIETPYTNTENFKIIVETPNKNNTIITCSMEDAEDRFIIELKTKVNTKNKLDCSLIFTLDTMEIDYKVMLDYFMEIDTKITEKIFKNEEISLDKTTKDALINEYEDNIELVTDKATKIYEKLFPDMVEKARLQKIKSDINRANIIGTSVALWKTEKEVEPNFVYDSSFYSWREYSSLEEIDEYLYGNYEPSLDNSKYYVAINTEGDVIVGISNKNAVDLPRPADVIEVTYNGEKSGIACIKKSYRGNMNKSSGSSISDFITESYSAGPILPIY